MNNVRKHSLFSFIILLMCNNVLGQINWNFTNASSSSGTMYNVTVGTLTQVNNNGSTTFIDAGSPASTGYPGASGNNNGSFSAKTGAINTSTSTYLQVVLTPASNYSLTFTGISWGNYSVSTSGPSLVSVYTSENNYAAALCSTSVLQNSAWSLLSPGFSSITTEKGKPLTIRIYASGGTGSVPAAGTANWRIDDLKINVKAMPVTETVYMSMKNAASPAASSPWNNITGLNSTSLLNSSGTSTSVGLEFLSGSWSNTGDQGRMTGNNSGVYPDAVIRDYYWCGAYGAPDSMLANIKGLDTGARYNVTFFGSSKWNGVSNNGTTIYTINGVGKPLYVDSNYLNTVSFTNTKPNSSGIIQFKFSKAQYTIYALVNAIVLDKLYDSAAIPVASWNYGGNTVGTVQKLGTTDNQDLPIITNDAERMRIKADGKIGVGVTNPDSSLHIVGGLKLVNGTEGAGKVLTSDSTGGASWQTAVENNFQSVYNASPTGVNYDILGSDPLRILINSTDTDGAIKFASQSNGTTLNVMNSSFPSSTGTGISVKSDLGIAADITAGTGYQNESTVLKLRKSGYVGTGAAAVVDFFVDGNQIQNTGKIKSVLTGANNPTASGKMEFWGLNASSPFKILTLHGGGQTQLHKYGTGLLTGVPAYGLGVDTNGNVVEFSPGNTIPTFTNRSVPYANSAGVLIEDNTGLSYNGNDLSVGHSDFYSTTGISINGGRGYFGASGFGMTVKTNGGTPADASKSINFYNSNRRYLRLYMKSDSTLNMESDVTIYPTVNNQRSLGQPANQWLNTYTQNLFVNGSLKFNISGVSAGYVLTSDASGNASWQPATGGSSQWTTSGSATYLNNTSGRVMIGMPALNDTNYRLFVSKGIRTQKVKVDQTTWADFVFNDNYHLPSLGYVEQYIKAHKHLPDVPAANEVASQGLDLGDMQKILLQKIEELTLYTIALEKVNNEQEAKLELAEKSGKASQAVLEALIKKVDALDKELKNIKADQR